MPLEPGQTAEVRRDMRHLAAVDEIAEGRHERFVVPDLARFIEGANTKRTRGSR